MGDRRGGSETPRKEGETKKVSRKNERRYVLAEKRVDEFNTSRYRVLLTPAVCIHCGFDVCARNGLKSYDELSDVQKQQVEIAVEKHKELVHNKAEARVLRESELPTEYLSTM